MKILLLGDASNYHATLAHGLKALGHDVTLASDGSRWMQTERNIDLSRADSRIGGAVLYARLSTVLAPRLRGYDVVQFVSPGFARLRPQRLEKLLKKLRRNNGSLYLTALGTDSTLVRNLSGPAPALRYSEWQTGGKPTPWGASDASKRDQWLARDLADYTEAFYSNIDGAVSALYEYHKIMEAEHPAIPLAYGGIPIDTTSLCAPRIKGEGERVKILFAAHRGREGEKGADVLFDLLKRLADEMPDKVELMMPPNMPLRQFISTLAEADMVSDQLYSFTPATTALMAMAMGVVPITGGEEEYYTFIGEHTARPIFNPDPEDLDDTYRRLKALVSDRAALRAMSAAAPAFVHRHNDAAVVARRFADFWQR